MTPIPLLTLAVVLVGGALGAATFIGLSELWLWLFTLRGEPVHTLGSKAVIHGVGALGALLVCVGVVLAADEHLGGGGD